ncbi:hydantoinase B/oxoprolinase family protein [Psychrobium sp. 1_MG-2023]|uniref:hydantoinase B/oxoprolinase family protein n=1 Tax=Psychrobium sp. 1_MG-2023 TaxID=3062624 RepID=UPI000C3316C0|nr:hydantoinase B/oxoprolinase family protein [Psychrobium sp. 1_MG-2023]MDP2560196.1 hydantoinase B/oxoprolinase family protein [Psychrobium sp. 1_MG-2023]PKF57007.1 5-oxoprolinase [Alteromonadales bacterium alter-6D02]
MGQWQIWVDRGGTFTDIVAKTPAQQIVSHKLLSNNPTQYQDATVAGVQQLLAKYADQGSDIEQIRIGTTVATNALLERNGEPTALVVTKGYADSLLIGYQHRRDLFVLDIKRAEPLYDCVVEINERVLADGRQYIQLDEAEVTSQLQALHQQGIRSLAIVFMHGYRYCENEQRVAQIARSIGFSQISTSHQISKLIKFISRGDTAVVDAYLSPVLNRYIAQTQREFTSVSLKFMQSSGGLVDSEHFKGKDAVLSGPAGGVVAMAETAKQLGHERVIGFDMGGTSTDVSLYNAGFERCWESEVAGVRLRAPMMKIHTVAAGGGSVLGFEHKRLTVGPDSAGAYPGPCCYRNDGPLTVTDINVLLGKIQPDLFPHIFGGSGQLPLDIERTREKFLHLTTNVNQVTSQQLSAEQLAQDYLTIAIEHMANAIKEISVAKGHDLSTFVMTCFGGAGAQHACLVAQVLGLESILIHPLSGVLSAYGMGLAQVRCVQQESVEELLANLSLQQIKERVKQLSTEVINELEAQQVQRSHIKSSAKLLIRYQGSDNSIAINVTELEQLKALFATRHMSQFGFINSQQPLIISAIECEAYTVDSCDDACFNVEHAGRFTSLAPVHGLRNVYFNGVKFNAPFFAKSQLNLGLNLKGPAVIVDEATTIIIEPGWDAVLLKDGTIKLVHSGAKHVQAYDTQCQPMLLEVFNNLFMHIAKEMGLALQASALSVNIKERLDFSCAIFDKQGELIANAPHMPVHLGSMDQSVKSIIQQNGQMKSGQSFLINSPYHGGTHLPDLTVVTPVFDQDQPQQLLFFVASRGHHADIGGISPGSMPAQSTHIEQEGILFENFLLVDDGEFNEQALIEALSNATYPARNIAHNIADLKAQLAANNKGIAEMRRVITQYSFDVVDAYMQHVQDNAEDTVRELIKTLDDGKFSYRLDQGSVVNVSISINKSCGEATVDFSGSSTAQRDNFNAPYAVTRAAVLYVFRSLVEQDIALNAGCLRPIKIIVEDDSMLNPSFPAAVVAGNVETSQVVTDVLLAALGKQAGSQGTMNNLTFGDDNHQYYETICGGSGAGPGFNGQSAVQTHMTNSRLTDPEILESRFPVVLKRFERRQGSGGQGQYCGGDGVIRELEFLEPMEASILSNRRSEAPVGILGGQPGQLGENYLVTFGGQQKTIAACAKVNMNVGDCLMIKTPGGGGFGRK